MEILLENLKYPVGKFDWSVEVSEQARNQAIRKIAALPSRLRAVVANLSDEQLNTPYRSEGWTVRQVVHHLADSHMNAYIRFKLALTEDNPIIKPYAETEWAKLPDSRLAPEVSLSLLEGVHKRWTTIMDFMNETQWELGFTHPEHNRFMVLNKAVAMYAWHCEHHMAHIMGLLERENW